MTPRRRIAAIALAAAAIALMLVTLASVRLSGTISDRLQQQVSRQLDADVSWDRLRVSLLRDFPRAGVRVSGLSVAGRGAFAGDTLLAVGTTRLAMDLGSVLRAVRNRGALEVLDLEIVRPRLGLIVHEDGTANWDLFGEPDEAGAERDGRAFDLNLRRFAIRDARITFDNRPEELVVVLDGVQHEMRGRLNERRFRLAGTTHADAVTLRAKGIPYLSDVATDVRYAFDVDADAGTVQLDEVELKLNELVLAVAGSVRTGELMAIDLRFDAPGGDFAQIASLVPALAGPGWQNANARGTLAASGWIRGDYGDDAFPAFDATFTARDGRLHHAEMPLPLDRVNADLAVRNPGGDLAATVIDLSRVDMVLGPNPVSGRVRIEAPFGDPSVDLAATGTVDLADLARTFPMEDIDDLRGRIAAELTAGFRLSDLDSGRYERVRADGSLSAHDIRYESETLPLPVDVRELQLALSPSAAELRTFSVLLGESDLSATGELHNLLGYTLRGQELSGRTRVTSRRFDLDPWRSDDETNAVPVPARLDLRVEGTVDHLTFNELDLTAVRGALHVRNERATLDELRFGMFEGDVLLTGYYDTSAGGAPEFEVHVVASEIDAPQAFAGMTTVRALAPAARWMRGRVSADVTMAGRLGEELTPIFNELDGRGAVHASDIALEGFPPLVGLATLVKVDALRNPTLTGIRSTFSIRDGRLHISPFDVGIAGYAVTVSGSHGFDESMDYRLSFRLPRSILATDVLDGFAAQASRVGLDLGRVDSVTLVGVMRGTVAQPAVSLDLGQPLPSASALVRQEAERRVDALVDQGQAAADDIRRAAEEDAARRRAEAERRAEAILAEARQLAEATRQEADVQANALVEQAGNPVARRAATIAADRLRREADQRADAIIRDAELRAARLVAGDTVPH